MKQNKTKKKTILHNTASLRAAAEKSKNILTILPAQRITAHYMKSY